MGAVGSEACSVGVQDSARHEAAARALKLYLEGFGWSEDSGPANLIPGCIAAAGGRVRPQKAADLEALAVEELEARLAAWFDFVLGDAAGAGSPTLVGRAALLASGGAAAWPGCFLSYDCPHEFASALRASAPAALPDEAPVAMVEQPYDVWSLRDLLPDAPLVPRPARISA